jgi:Tfp pilus assembly protein PilV
MIKLSGQSIVETVIAAALISVTIITALSLSVYSQKQSTYAKNLVEASKYAAQGADWLRAQRALLGWDGMAASSGTYCLNTIPTAPNDFTSLSSGSCSPNTYIDSTIYTRQINVDNSRASSGSIKITVTVIWTDSTSHATSLEAELTKWQ